LTSGSSRTDVLLHRVRANCELMRGNLEAARASAAAAKALATELGLNVLLATGIARTSVQIDLFDGDFEAAEAEAAFACDLLEAAQDWGHYVSQLPLLMDALYPQGRAEEVAEKLELAEGYAIEEDLDAQVSLRRARSMLLLSRGDEARRLVERFGLARSLPFELLRDLPIWDRTREGEPGAPGAGDALGVTRFLLDSAALAPFVLVVERFIRTGGLPLGSISESFLSLLPQKFTCKVSTLRYPGYLKTSISRLLGWPVVRQQV